LLCELQHSITTHNQQLAIAEKNLYQHFPQLPSDAAKPPLSPEESQHIAGCVRINHTGEICAQALYRSQALLAETDTLKTMLLNAAIEEEAHLHWCYVRLCELNAKPSLLNPIWYAGSFLLGTLAGKFGKEVSLGFVVETEHQVSAHLEEHLHSIAPRDLRTKTILKQMKKDEEQHAQHAQQQGAKTFSMITQKSMHWMAKIMKIIVYRI
jgi:3-demethoxyubiquinol 3-hydroxylase